jgi:hypothetical protein
LPGRIYRSKDGRIKTARYFVDKFPLFLSRALGAGLLWSVLLHRRGDQKAISFDTYLLQYRDLFARLDSFRVVYVTADQSMFPKAESIFSRLCGGRQSTERHAPRSGSPATAGSCFTITIC